jgi:hypothetical protein
MTSTLSLSFSICEMSVMIAPCSQGWGRVACGKPLAWYLAYTGPWHILATIIIAAFDGHLFYLVVIMFYFRCAEEAICREEGV